MPTDQDRTSLLRASAHAFSHALINPPAPSELLSRYFTSTPTIHEHGPSWASTQLPFLGRRFHGAHECATYFETLSSTLKMQLRGDSFPGPEGFVVDADANTVTVVGSGVFESTRTGRSWEERFVWVLGGWDDQGRVGTWDVWADPLSAWCAVQEGEVEGWGKGERRS
ncbi:uncharacterized protein K452DRAFT_283098 [Aplosporella prunicola CBS 121167]|uniref:SnoaL-like domain-containing protein n=1 Tax=Aplosporella prunicola CBS 121167 TaxID=1176127 RepID=A0A6A6BVL7_9PEZI|nr:uncharacterized protein K452DRAFT_283098 [Aplosporella prunicola CBS 121167]KAF2146897.1 hypothetical protein K452DRAFT_283098 [Aplosporella prunicola CBS 121167]